MADVDTRRQGSDPQDNMDAQRTYEQVQRMKRTWESHDGSDKALAATDEYLSDSSYRQSEEYQAEQRLDRAINMTSLLAADYQTIKNTEFFDNLTVIEQAAIIQEYNRPSIERMKKFQNDMKALDNDIQIPDYNTLQQQGFIDYKASLNEEEIKKLEDWLKAPEAPGASKILEELNNKGSIIDLGNMSIARTQVTAMLSDEKFTVRKTLTSQEVQDMRILTRDTKNLSSEEKSHLLETVRTKKIQELANSNESIRAFMQKHPNATAAEWKKALTESKKILQNQQTKQKSSGSNNNNTNPNQTTNNNPPPNTPPTSSKNQSLQDNTPPSDTTKQMQQSVQGVWYSNETFSNDEELFVVTDTKNAGKVYSISPKEYFENPQEYTRVILSESKELLNRDISVKDMHSGKLLMISQKEYNDSVIKSPGRYKAFNERFDDKTKLVYQEEIEMPVILHPKELNSSTRYFSVPDQGSTEPNNGRDGKDISSISRDSGNSDGRGDTGSYSFTQSSRNNITPGGVPSDGASGVLGDLEDGFDGFLFDVDGQNGLDAIFNNYGEMTQSTGLYKKDAITRSLSFFTGDLAPTINLMSMGGRAGYKAYDIAYRKWLEKSKDELSQKYREAVKANRNNTRSNNAATRHEAKENIRAAKADYRFDKKMANWQKEQRKKYGNDTSKWEKPPSKTPYKQREFGDTIKGKVLKKINNSKIGKFLGKLFGLKDKFMNFVLNLGKHAIKFVGVGLFYIFIALNIVAAIFMIAFVSVTVFASMFSSLTPEYAQNCINNLNTLDELYVLAVENEIKRDYMSYGKDEYGNTIDYETAVKTLGTNKINATEVTSASKYDSKKYNAQVLLKQTEIVNFVDEYGKKIASPNNILPIFAAFKYRTGVDVNENTYVAASAYGQLMYARTHSVTSEHGDTESLSTKFDFLEDCKGSVEGCEHFYHGDEDHIVYNDVDYCEIDGVKHYCDNYGIDVLRSKPFKDNTICGKKEHIHDDDCEGLICDIYTTHSSHDWSCYRQTCELEECEKTWSMLKGWHCIIEDEDHIHHEHDWRCYDFSCLECDEHIHSSSCYGIVCGIEQHVHDDTLSVSEDGLHYSTPCYNVEIECKGHCPGHVDVSRTIVCTMDILNIVKQDDLIFTKEALSVSDNVWDWTGVSETKLDAFKAKATNWWNEAIKKHKTIEELYTTEDFYNNMILDISYGMRNEPDMFRDYHDTLDADGHNGVITKVTDVETGKVTKPAIFYDVSSLRRKLQSLPEYLAYKQIAGEYVDRLFEENFNTSRLDDIIKSWTHIANQRVATKCTSFAESMGYHDTFIPSEKQLEKWREEHGFSDTTEYYSATDYLSPFIFDGATLNVDSNNKITEAIIKDNIPIFHNGWGFYPKKQSGYASFDCVTYTNPKTKESENLWIWCVDPDYLTSVVGTYDDGYLNAVNSFAEESKIYFANANPGMESIPQEELKANKNLQDIMKKLDYIYSKSKSLKNADGTPRVLTEYEAFAYLAGKNSELKPTSANSLWSDMTSQDKEYEPIKIKDNTLIARRYLKTSESYGDSNWDKNLSYDYFFMYILELDDKAGNWGAGEKYYTCLVFDRSSYGSFRFITMPETSIQLYQRYKKY